MEESFDPPLYRYERRPGLPPVSLRGLGAHAAAARSGPHRHDFLVLAYIAAGRGELRLAGRPARAGAGDCLVVAPGVVVEPAADRGAPAVEGWAAFFPPDVLAARTPGAFLSWRAHPLLYPFAGGTAGGAQRLHVPVADRPIWSGRFAALERELAERRDGYGEAVLAELTLLLVDVSRLAADVVGDLTLRDEPLLAAVFGVIEDRYATPISLADVARAVSLSPAHLTTVVGRKTGRTVQQWITERRMTEARRLLVTTDLPVRAVATAVGFRDAGYFIRAFKRAHGVTPLHWRRADLGPAGEPARR